MQDRQSIDNLREAKIGNLDNGRVVVSEQHILQLQVTVGDALRMHILLKRQLRR